jgi:hypothetical protein
MTGDSKFKLGPLRSPGRERELQNAFGFRTDYNIDVIVALATKCAPSLLTFCKRVRMVVEVCGA